MNLNFSQIANRFLLSVLEGLVDGIMMLNADGELMYTNSRATEICRKLNAESSLVPAEVWRSCEALIDSRELYGDRPLVIESEFTTIDGQTYRTRAQWLTLDGLDQPCLLVRLEDQQQSLQSLAFSEARLFGLTPREAEVWLLRRCNLSRKEIADRLYITIDTVKKHLGNIQMKRQATQEEWCC
ncbi:helix-turn-helix transcriptional regulator [Myxacorys almedinensis A]|uniref:Helix-turn-helix transcriptional regulator n=2 Tax=Myxacorys TaxID=2056239 RepID=A0A8J7Z2B9_9CYAN|nr:helix-turn-helix transcriptional regulator [Myxacorys almedinensis A]